MAAKGRKSRKEQNPFFAHYVPFRGHYFLSSGLGNHQRRRTRSCASHWDMSEKDDPVAGGEALDEFDR